MKLEYDEEYNTLYCNEQSYGNTVYLTILKAERETVISLRNQTMRMYPGDIILCRENIPYESEEGTLHAIFCPREFFDSLFYSQIADCRILYEFMSAEVTHDEYLYFHLEQQVDCIRFLSLLEDELKRDDIYNGKLLRLMMVGLFTCLDRTRSSSLIVQQSTMISDNRFGMLMKYIGENYAVCTLGDLARRYGYHPDYLSTRFKIITGMTFSEKLLEIRLTEAANLLRSSELRIEDIALSVGFQDKSWFIKKFREKFEMNPSVYRRNYRNGVH